MDESLAGAAVLVVHEPGFAPAALDALLASLAGAGLVAAAHVLSPAALESDRRALPELDRALDALRARPGVDAERLAVLGFARGGTLAFLLACTRRLAAAVDVEGPVLHRVLSPERPTQPLELGLNLEGAFLGLFAEHGAVSAEERRLLEERLRSAARPFELVLVPGRARGFLDPRGSGYDGARDEDPAGASGAAPPSGAAMLARVLDFLRMHLAPEPE